MPTITIDLTDRQRWVLNRLARDADSCPSCVLRRMVTAKLQPFIDAEDADPDRLTLD